MSETTKLMVTNKDFRDAAKEAERREWWINFWLCVVAVLTAVGITFTLIALTGGC